MKEKIKLNINKSRVVQSRITLDQVLVISAQAEFHPELLLLEPSPLLYSNADMSIFLERNFSRQYRVLVCLIFDLVCSSASCKKF